MKLPPLTALRAFESAARNLSFTRAAEDLHVSQGAISQQISRLEEYLGVILFVRDKRRIQLTAEGHQLAETVRRAFSDIADASQHIQHKDQQPLSVSVPPAMAAYWLMPRLASFQAGHPEVTIRLDATTNVANLQAGEVDMAIRFGEGNYPGLNSVFLMRDQVFPVCSPAFLAQAKTPLPLGKVADYPLLHYEVLSGPRVHYSWSRFLGQFNLTGIDTHKGPVFHQHYVLLQAAIHHQGIALAQSNLVEAELRSGRLIRPFAESVPHNCAYYIVYPQEGKIRPEVLAFQMWLESQVNTPSDVTP